MLFHPGWHYLLLLSERIPLWPFLTLADCNEALPDSSGLQCGPARPSRTSASARWGICPFLPADLYSHADASRPIPFDSPRRADPNKALPDSGGHLPTEISASFILLTSSHADASKPIPFNSPRPADSNAPCPDAVRPLVEILSKPLHLSSPGKYFQIGGYGVL